MAAYNYTPPRNLPHRQKKEPLFCESFREDTVAPFQTGKPGALEQQIARELVSAALSGLPEVQREAITLAYFDGLTGEEIAIHTKSSLGTTKSRLRSALRTMKRELSNPRLSAPPAPEPDRRGATLENVLITDQLLSRSCRQRSSLQEAECVRILTQAVAASPEQMIDSFLKMPIELCRAGTAGLSFLETNASGEQVFRWTNLAGKLAKSVGGTTPRNFSPCGVTLDRDSTQLFAYPGRYFQYFNQVEVPIVEGLVIPFHVGPKTEGTVWIISHEEKSRFDSEDVRIMTNLAEFVGCALHLVRTFDLKRATE